jgi:hypothetical protein
MPCVLHSITMRETLAEIVISEVKIRRILRDMKHKSYHNRMPVDREWRKVAENVGETSKYFVNFIIDSHFHNLVTQKTKRNKIFSTLLFIFVSTN